MKNILRISDIRLRRISGFKKSPNNMVKKISRKLLRKRMARAAFIALTIASFSCFSTALAVDPESVTASEKSISLIRKFSKEMIAGLVYVKKSLTSIKACYLSSLTVYGLAKAQVKSPIPYLFCFLPSIFVSWKALFG